MEAKGEVFAAHELYQAASALLHQITNPMSEQATNEGDLGRITMMLGRYDEAIAHTRESIRLYEQMGDQANAATEHMNLSYTLNVAERYEEAFDAAIRLAQTCKDPFGEAPAWRWLALADWQQGKHAEAREAMARACALFEKMGMTHEVAAIEKLTASWGA